MLWPDFKFNASTIINMRVCIILKIVNFDGMHGFCKIYLRNAVCSGIKFELSLLKYEAPLRSECQDVELLYIYIHLNELISEMIIACRYGYRIYNAINLKY